MRRLAIAFTTLASIGAATVVILTVISGFDYRMQEQQGLQPGYAPAWIVTGTTAGLAVFAGAMLALAAIGVAALVRQRRRDARR